MSGIKGRLYRLEQRAGGHGRRCDHCRGWGPRITGTDWRTGRPRTSGPPERCPVCGFVPMAIVIEYVEDWRGQRQVRPV